MENGTKQRDSPGTFLFIIIMDRIPKHRRIYQKHTDAKGIHKSQPPIKADKQHWQNHLKG